jgi:hypothetical protein
VPNCRVDGCQAAHHHLLHGALVQGRVMVVQEVGAKKAGGFLCREDVRVRSAGEANSLHTLYDWGATVTLVTHASAAKVGLERKRQVATAIAGLGGHCTMVDSNYMVPVVDSNDVVRVVKALGVDHITRLAAADITGDIVTRIPQTEGFAEKLARPAGDVEIGMDNQGWMPVHVESSRLESDNLRLMQSVLSPRCILMGSIRMPEQGRGTQGSVVSTPVAIKQPGGRRLGVQPRNSMRVMMTMMLRLRLQQPEFPDRAVFAARPRALRQHGESARHREIVKIKKERLVQVTRCTATQTNKSVYCGPE